MPEGRVLFGPETSAPAAAAPGRDLLAQTPEQQRAERLRKIARATMQQDPGAGTLFGDAFTLGLKKPVAGLAQGVGNVVTGQGGFGEGYTAGTGAYQDMLDEASANAGWGGTAANVAGSLTAGAPARVVAAAPGLLRMIGSAAGFGAVEGAARNSEDVGSALGGALRGGGTAAATTGLLGAGTQALGFRARRAAREQARGTPPEVLKDQARDLYRQLDEAGVAYSRDQSFDFVDNAISDLRQNQWSPTGVHSQLNGVIAQIEELRGQPITLERLQELRETLGAEAGSNEPQIRRIAGRLIGSIDGFVREVEPTLSQLPAEQIAPMWGAARQLWRNANTAEDIGWRVRKAERRAASTNSGQNTENAIRQNIRQVVDKAEQPRRYNPFSRPEIAQMERVVEGSPAQNTLRWIGNQVSGIPAQTITGGTGAALTGLGLGSGLDVGTALMAGGAGLSATAATQGVGHLIKGQAGRMAQDEADTLMRLITTGSTAPLPLPSGPPTRENLARLLMQQWGQQALPMRAGIAAGSYAGGQQ